MPHHLATPTSTRLQADTGIEPFWTKILQALRQLAHHAASGLLDALCKWRFEANSERESGSSLALAGGAEGRQQSKKVTISAGLDDGRMPTATVQPDWQDQTTISEPDLASPAGTCMSPQRCKAQVTHSGCQ